MPRTNHSPEQNGGSGVDRLRNELTEYLGARAHQWTDSAAEKLSDTATRLTRVADNGGLLPRPGLKFLMKAATLPGAVKKKVAGVKEAVTGAVRGVVGKAGGGRKATGVKATNIIESIDVGVPLRRAYDRWSRFENFNEFMKGVESVSKEDDVTSNWRVKVAFSKRTWKAKIEEQVPDELITWTSEGPKGTTKGTVSFHELAPRLTRVTAAVEYSPSGFFEKTGNIWRAQGRRLRLDLKHFQRHVTLTPDEEFEGWRGEIRDGEVVLSHEDALRKEEEAWEEKPEEEAREEGSEEGEEPEEEEEVGDERDYEAEEDEEDEYEDEDEEEDEEPER